MIRAYKDNVVIRVDQREARKTTGGIFLPDSWENSQYGQRILSGIVLSAGPGGKGEDGKDYPVDVRDGDRVLIGNEAGQECVLGDDVEHRWCPDIPPGTELRIVRCEEILAAIEED